MVQPCLLLVRELLQRFQSPGQVRTSLGDRLTVGGSGEGELPFPSRLTGLRGASWCRCAGLVSCAEGLSVAVLSVLSWESYP